MNSVSLYQGHLINLTALNPEKDAEAISLWTNSHEFVRNNFEGLFRPYRIDELKKKLKEKLKKADERKDEFYFAIHAKESGELVGLLRLGWLMPTHQIARMFLDFSNDDAFEHYSEDALLLAIRYAFMELSLYRLTMSIPSHDESKIRLFEKAGFLREAQRRQNIYYDGKYYDELIYAILRPEWKAMRKETI